ncbi:MAG: Na+:H+ antiporter, NhaC family [Thermovirga sp.]|nr:Na+:H+ antiporter, NhaC family [Thermovirga sp.]
MSKKREVGLSGALFILASILGSMIVGKLLLKFDTAMLIMGVSMLTTAIYVFYYRFSWQELFDGGVIPMIGRASGAILILLTVGPMIAIWMISGTVPYLIYLGLNILTPKTFLISASIICAISSVVTGTSWGSAATFGVAFMGIAYGLGVPLPAAAGAVVAGSYFGDKISPVSDTTVLAAATAEADLIDHIKSMMWTTLPAFLIGLILYGIVGAQSSGTIDTTKIDSILAAIQANFNLTPIVLVPPVMLLLLAYLRYPTLPVLWVSMLAAVPIAIFQGHTIPEIVKVMAKGPALHTGVEAVDKLLNRGGLSFMAGAVAVVFFAYIFAGQLEYSGTVRRVTNALRERFIKNSIGRFIFSTSLTGILTALGTGNSYLSIIMPGTMYKDLCDDLRVARRVLSRTLEDSGTVVVPLVPWSAAGIYMSTVLGVPVLDYLPWAVMCYAGALIAWIYGFTGIGIFREE